MIEDDELRSIFKIESAEHIQRLEEGFLRIEKNLKNKAVIEEIFREAHSLKGAAHMLGLKSLESVSHLIEDILSAARDSSVPLTPEIIERLYKGLDVMASLVKESVTGEESGVDLPAVLELLKGNSGIILPVNTGIDSEKTGSPYQLEDDIIPAAAETEIEKPVYIEEQILIQQGGDPASDHETGETTLEKYRIDTIRVETKRLDKLMSQSGELIVTRLRIAKTLEDADELFEMWKNIYKSIQMTSIGNNPAAEKFGELLNTLKSGLHNESSRLDHITAELEDSINRIRLLPVSSIFNLFKRMVRDLSKERLKDVRFVIEGGETAADKRIIEEIKDPLMHLLRNAVDHGIELPDVRTEKNKPRTGTIILRAYQTSSNLIIEVIDDGQGLDTDAIKKAALKIKILNENELSSMSASHANSLIFISGVSTSAFLSDISGRGVGLDAAKSNIERLKGTIQIESMPDSGCTIRIKLPLTLAATKVLIVEADNIKYAIPVEYIQTIRFIEQKNIFTIQGRMTILIDKTPVSAAVLSDVLEIKKGDNSQKSNNTVSELLPCVIISTGEDKLGLFVNELIDEQDVVLKQYSNILKRVRNISGSTILGTGELCLILNPEDLIKSVWKSAVSSIEVKTSDEPAAAKRILIAEDSMTVRTQMKRILEGAGYDVEVAVDGLEAFNKLSGSNFDAIVTDIQMPNMTGLELTEKIRQNNKYSDMPVILVTSLSSEPDKKRGIEAGANAYITKPSFDQKVLLDTLRRLV
jgi:two-component system chemotaxis sensor kinase CheA